MSSGIPIVLYANPEEVDKYGEEGLKLLWTDILDRYANDEYYDPDLVEELLENQPE